ncbi:fuculose phosphate aldolase [Betaproteobacteria bacterium]|nr:fuculose phosphate aldolase [Betaproteobacteria bacterium]GHU42853.1 fuculose phosphate aldolase [Betaproteobacteria bacterium]
MEKALIASAQAMRAAGLNKGTAGNLSCRLVREGRDGFLITPTGMDYAALTPEDIPWVAVESGEFTGKRKPSSEWRFHRDLYAARPEVGAVLHAHSPFAVSLACLGRDIPPFHYMIARFGGDSIRCGDYALFGTQALSDAALAALKDRTACLLANHGMLVCGRDLKQALDLGVELESLCEQYWRASLLGEPRLLDAKEMTAVLEKFEGYGRQDEHDMKTGDKD